MPAKPTSIASFHCIASKAQHLAASTFLQIGVPFKGDVLVRKARYLGFMLFFRTSHLGPKESGSGIYEVSFWLLGTFPCIKGLFYVPLVWALTFSKRI